MNDIANNVLELIGNTPMLRLSRLASSGSATLLAKMESLNPGGSVKDRIALSMIEEAEAAGRIHPGDIIVEPTSGNTGVSLAMVAAVKDYRVVLTMPQGMSTERTRLLTRLGAKIVFTPSEQGMSGAVRAAEKLVAGGGYFMPQQFQNPENAKAHRNTTGPEILRATGGRVDAFVAGIGTGGTLIGVAEAIKEVLPDVRIVAVEPSRSALLSTGRSGVHGIQGLGPDFVPVIVNRSLIDSIVTVTDDDAHKMMLRLMREEGLLVGISSGANVFAALTVAESLGKGKVVVTVLPDTGDRYLSVSL